jgi:hypothetical protein
MMIASMVARASSAAALTTVLLCLQPSNAARAQEPTKSAAPIEARISALIPDFEARRRTAASSFTTETRSASALSSACCPTGMSA